MVASSVAKVVAKLIFLLIAQRRKQCDRRGELIVAVGLEAGDSQGRGTEWKSEREAQIGVAGLSQVQQTCVEDKCAQPSWAECVGVADYAVPVIIVRGQPGRRQRCLLYERVVREIAIFRGTEEPL